MSGRIAIIAGASGLIGVQCLQLLLKDPRYEKVVSIARKKIDMIDVKLENNRVDFSKDDISDLLIGDDVFCCIGSTIKQAGSKEAFYEVDHDIPVMLAEAAGKNKVPGFHLISAMGANKDSRIFYNRVKGQMEEDIKKIPFERINILRPSLLLGDRQEFRLGEIIATPLMKLISPLMVGSFENYRPVHVKTVARAMHRAAISEEKGIRIIESAEIRSIGM